MFQSRTPQLLGVALLCTALVLAGQSSFAEGDPPRLDDGHHRVVLPRGHGFVSLTLAASDDAGSELDQRIIRAWYVR